jgi:hypothetical protein
MRPFLFYLLFVSTAIAYAQDGALHVRKATGPIVIDGEMNEPDWGKAELAEQFKQYFPFDSSYAVAPTEVRMLYDDRFIYVYAVMYSMGPRKYITNSLRRDFSGGFVDTFNVLFDTYKDKTNGFQFGTTPFGVQREGLISNGGASLDDLSLNWDNKWYSESKILNDRWVCEIAIPFKTMRFKHGLDSWHLNFYRTDSHYTERSTWAPIARVYPIVNLATMRELVWDKPLQHPGGNVSIIPYAAIKSEQDFESGTPRDTRPDIGGDAKIAVGPALNLDLTANPDFSQVEVDQQVTNLNRFEIFYPEKRQFFLENGDLFANFGYSNMRPFFSRRIGVTRDPSTGQNIQNRIYGGARLSGKINNNWRVGLMTMQAAEDNAINLPSINYTVAAVQRKVFTRSNIGMIVINKQGFNDTSYNRLLGLEYNLASKDNRFTGKAFYHRSFNQQKTDSSYAASAQITYRVPNLEIDLLAQDIGAHYNPEVGYAPRKNFRRIAPEMYYSFYPKSKLINSHGPGTDIDVIWNQQNGVTDADFNLWYTVNFQNSAQFFIRIRNDYGLAFFPFDPTFPADPGNAINLPAGSSYSWNSVIAYFASNARRKLFYNIQTRSGQYYNGSRVSFDGSLSYRLQPHAVISMNFTYNRIRLPSPYNDADLILLGPKFDLTFSRKLFWTTYFQYNNQIKNLNINSRLQWRFKPVSDLYLVYTDNYFAEASSHDEVFYVGQPKLRAIVLKLTYWINL